MDSDIRMSTEDAAETRELLRRLRERDFTFGYGLFGGSSQQRENVRQALERRVVELGKKYNVK